MPLNNQLVLLILGLISFNINAQKIYTVDYSSVSDIKVFVVDYPSQADLKVFKVDYKTCIAHPVKVV